MTLFGREYPFGWFRLLVLLCLPPCHSLSSLWGGQNGAEFRKSLSTASDGSATVKTPVCTGMSAFPLHLKSALLLWRNLMPSMANLVHLSTKISSHWSMDFTLSVIEHWNKLPRKMWHLLPLRCSRCDWAMAAVTVSEMPAVLSNSVRNFQMCFTVFSVWEHFYCFGSDFVGKVYQASSVLFFSVSAALQKFNLHNR